MIRRPRLHPHKGSRQSGPPLRVLALFAHPDDAEFLCAGTLGLLANRGAVICIATMTSGDCGSTTLPPQTIARIRRNEGERAAGMIAARYTTLGQKDLSIFYDRPTLEKVMGLVRNVNATLVFTHSPVDYMVDHETTSRLAQTACFGSTARNYRTGVRSAAPPLARIPHLYYAEPFGGRDILGQTIRPTVFVGITATLALKGKMLKCHESQQAWLSSQQGISNNIEIMHQMAERAGRLSGFRWAEGFRQHLGQGFPQDNLLEKLLKGLVRRTKPKLD